MARATSGFSGAELANLVNEAAICAVRANKSSVDDECYEAALQEFKVRLTGSLGTVWGGPWARCGAVMRWLG